MDIKILEDRLGKLFSDAIDVHDTIWYSETETLRDAILDMVVGLPDEVAACNLIHSQRKQTRTRHKRSYRKTMTNRLSREEGLQLSERVRIYHDPKTESVVAGSCLAYCSCEIFPGTHQHRTCIGGTAIATVKATKKYGMRQREADRIYANDPNTD
jgi:hypothetical protein